MAAGRRKLDDISGKGRFQTTISIKKRDSRLHLKLVQNLKCK